MIASPRRLVYAGSLLAAALHLPAALSAQTTSPPAPPAATPASPLLPATHWAVEAARRAEALGWVEWYLPAQGAVQQEVVRRALEDGMLRAREDRGRTADLLADWHARFLEEFPAPESPGSARWQRRWALAEARTRSGAAAPGRGVAPDNPTGAEPLDDGTSPLFGADLAAGFGATWSVHVAPAVGADDLYWSRGDVRARWRGLSFAAGRQPVSYGPGHGGGVILSGQVPLNRLEIETPTPFRLPGALGGVGPLALHFFLATLAEERHDYRDPMMWGATLTGRPHARLTWAIHRGAMFAPISEWRARELLWMLVGRVKGKGFENQQVALSARLRVPTDDLFPLTAYGEWGSEDSAGAWWDVPGRTFGAFLPALPFAPAVALGAEHTYFAPRNEANPPWYRHSLFPGSWASGDGVLGHPLGGEGNQWLGYAEADLAHARLRVEAQFFRRERAGSNLFVPGREGRSWGGEAHVRHRLGTGVDLRLSGAWEAGDDWDSGLMRAGATWYF